MTATYQPSIDVTTCQKQLANLNRNLSILREREAKYAGNAPLELLNQIEDHLQAIDLFQQALTGQLSEAELTEALRPLLLAMSNGQVVNISAGTYIAGDQTISQVTIGDVTEGIHESLIAGRDIIIQQARSAAEEAEKAQHLAARRLAEGVANYVQRLVIVARPSASATDNPYKGLLAYRLSDADRFFGRNQAVEALLRIINRSPLTVLHAQSGAGKTSLLQAGISPRLLARNQPNLPVYIRAYNLSPTLAIKRAFLPNLDQVSELAQTSLRDFLHQVITVLGLTSRLYLLLDQFEETFTLLNESERTTFVNRVIAE